MYMKSYSVDQVYNYLLCNLAVHSGEDKVASDFLQKWVVNLARVAYAVIREK